MFQITEGHYSPPTHIFLYIITFCTNVLLLYNIHLNVGDVVLNKEERYFQLFVLFSWGWSTAAANVKLRCVNVWLCCFKFQTQIYISDIIQQHWFLYDQNDDILQWAVWNLFFFR